MPPLSDSGEKSLSSLSSRSSLDLLSLPASEHHSLSSAGLTWPSCSEAPTSSSLRSRVASSPYAGFAPASDPRVG
ncbi:hypothetical protein PC119_g25177 [Phytophthora cactorum]|nr:hypothetical protein PC119_g25177 [Phytophthora cactorum]